MKKSSFNQAWTLKHNLSTIMESVMPSGGAVEEVTLPHDALIAMRRSADSAGGPGMGYFQGENIEYRKTFVIPSAEKDQVHYLNFDGVYMNASYWINGVFVGSYPYGYAPCSMRIDEFIKYDEPNTLRVMIRGSALPNARWYPGLGIYRDAWLLTGESLHLADNGLHITTLHCDTDLAVLEVKAKVQNAGAAAREAYAHLTVKDQNGNVVARRKSRFYVSANDRVEVRQRVDIENPQIWDVDTPNLYTCECVLVDKHNGEAGDRLDTTFGIRKLQLDAKYGIRLNGKPIKLKGGCVHHDNGCIGAVSVLDAEIRKVRKHKEAGYNALRTAHNPPSAAFLEACDRVGMLVMHEFTDVWTEAKAVYDYGEFMPQTWEKDLEAVVNRDYNHPSVIMWSIGNEIPETGNPISNKWGRKLVDKFRSLDQSRFITNGVNVMMSCIPRMQEVMKLMAIEAAEMSGGINDLMNDVGGVMKRFAISNVPTQFVEEACDMLDLVGYNYTAERYEKEHPDYPDRIYYGSETSPQVLDTNWAIVERNAYVVGDFCWTSWDYLGEVGIGRVEPMEENNKSFMGDYPWIAAYDADFDLTGYRRPISYWRQIIWGGRNHKPYIAVQRPCNYGKEMFYGQWSWTDSINSWTWPGYEGKKTAVEIYSDAEEAELFVNGVSQGKKPVGDDFRKFYCKWEAVYEPGDLLAVAYIGGKEVGRYELKTAQGATLCVSADKTTLKAGSNDLCYVEIELRDENGTLDMNACATAQLQIEGAVLLGSGSGDPKTEEKYQDLVHKFFEGRMIAVVKAPAVAGTAKLTVSSEGMQSISVDIQIV